jgi:hypothetical protein
MKNNFFAFQICIFLFGAIQSNAQQNPLVFGLDRRSGQLIGTDVISKQVYDKMTQDSGQIINGTGPWHHRISYLLGAAFELETNGESLEGWIIVSKYHRVVNKDTPADWITRLWIDATDKSTYLGGAYYGHSMQLYQDPQPIQSTRLLKVNVLAKEYIHHKNTENLDENEDEELYVLKINFLVPLSIKTDHLPSIEINGSMEGDDIGWIYDGSHNHTTVEDIKSQIKNILVTTNKSVAIRNKAILPSDSKVQSSTSNTSTVLPGVMLSITKKDGFLLIAFSPAATNASLEEAKLNLYPWVWQPATTITNTTTNGWYVTPTIESRIFRLRLGQ